MKLKKMFEETDRLGNEIARLNDEIDNINSEYMKIMNSCSHEIVVKYHDNRPRKLMIDGTYFCPACGRIVRCIIKEEIEDSSFKKSRIIPLDNLSLLSTREIFQMIRSEVYNNMDFYYNQDTSIDEIIAKMEELLSDMQYDYRDNTFMKKKKR